MHRCPEDFLPWWRRSRGGRRRRGAAQRETNQSGRAFLCCSKWQCSAESQFNFDHHTWMAVRAGAGWDCAAESDQGGHADQKAWNKSSCVGRDCRQLLFPPGRRGRGWGRPGAAAGTQESDGQLIDSQPSLQLISSSTARTAEVPHYLGGGSKGARGGGLGLGGGGEGLQKQQRNKRPGISLASLEACSSCSIPCTACTAAPSLPSHLGGGGIGDGGGEVGLRSR